MIRSRKVSRQLEEKLVATVFHTQNICHYAWKTVRTTLQYIVVLQLRGEGNEQLKKIWENLCFLDLLPAQVLGHDTRI